MSKKSQEKSSRVTRRRARVRERILAVAAGLFAERGIDNVTLADITDEADISRGNLYSHFGGKQELVHAICRPALEYSAERMQTLVGLPAAEAIEGMLRLHAELWRKFPGVPSVMQQLRHTPVGESTAGHGKHIHDEVPIFQQAVGKNILRLEPELALKLLSIIAVPLLELAQEAPNPDEFFVESMLRLLLKDG